MSADPKREVKQEQPVATEFRQHSTVNLLFFCILFPRVDTRLGLCPAINVTDQLVTWPSSNECLSCLCLFTISR